MPVRRFPPQRTAVVTGGFSPRGIGRALAGRLAEGPRRGRRVRHWRDVNTGLIID